jgi:predicted RecA/RadA family phage recombinase
MRENMFVDSRQFSGAATAAVTKCRAAKQGTTANEDFKFTLAGVGDEPCGIFVTSAASGAFVQVAFDGFGLAEVNGATLNIAKGDKLKPSTNGLLVLAFPGDLYIAEAMEPSTADGDLIRVYIKKGIAAYQTQYTNASATPATVAATAFGSGMAVIVGSVAGVQTINIPGGASVKAGTILVTKKTGSAGAMTLTPATGTIAGASTHTAQDALNDTALFFSDGTNWLLGPNLIA